MSLPAKWAEIPPVTTNHGIPHDSKTYPNGIIPPDCRRLGLGPDFHLLLRQLRYADRGKALPTRRACTFAVRQASHRSSEINSNQCREFQPFDDCSTDYSDV